MGCVPSKEKRPPPPKYNPLKRENCPSSSSKKRSHTKARDSVEFEELTEADLEQLQEEMRRKQELEEDFTAQLYAEKKALQEVAMKMIGRTMSCESLMELLLQEGEYDRISREQTSLKQQKFWRRKMLKARVGRDNIWMLYNNMEAISEPNMVHLALFMQKVLNVLPTLQDLHGSDTLAPPEEDGSLTPNVKEKLRVVVNAASYAANANAAVGDATGATVAASGDLRDAYSEKFIRLRSQSSRTPRTPASNKRGGSTRSSIKSLNERSPSMDLSSKSSIAFSDKYALPSPPSPGDEQVADMNSQKLQLPPTSPSSCAASINDQSSFGSPPLINDHASPSAVSLLNDESEEVMEDISYHGPRFSNYDGDDDELLRVRRSSDLFENVRTLKKTSHHTARMSSLAPSVIEKHRRELLRLPIYSIAPLNFYDISMGNLMDYELPPGCVTIRVVKIIVELFRKGGRLAPNSVHKLLRLAYKSLKPRPNTTLINLNPGDKLTVVGDLHGQLNDLLHIIDGTGMPSARNRYLFNGDFVDRGAHGVEVMCILLALHISQPDFVTFNRGNHEDFAICTVYGFQSECCEKYGEVIFGMFVEVFQQIPLFAVVNEDVFILHGGLFHTRDARIHELDDIDRPAFSLEDLPENGEDLEPVPREKRTEYLKQLVRDALWSDPVNQDGLYDSVRGAGVSFGPDITRSFLEANNLNMVVRSHECVRSGYDEPFSGEDSNILCTIFSASDYGGAGNCAAYLVFTIPEPDSPLKATEEAKDATTPNTSAVTAETPTLNGRKKRLRRVLSQEVRQMSITSSVKLALGQGQFDNCSDVKYVPNSNITFTVHYYFAVPTGEETDISAVHSFDNLVAAAATVSGCDSSSSDAAAMMLNSESVESTSPEGRRTVGFVNASGKPLLNKVKQGDRDTEPFGVRDRALSKFRPRDQQVVIGAPLTLYEYISSRKDDLLTAFEEADTHKHGVVTRYQWVNVMRETMNIHIRWISVMQILVLDTHYKMYLGKRMVDYVSFLDSFQEDDDSMTFAGSKTEIHKTTRSIGRTSMKLQTIEEAEAEETDMNNNSTVSPPRGAVYAIDNSDVNGESEAKAGELIDSTTVESSSERVSLTEVSEQKDVASSRASHASNGATHHSGESAASYSVIVDTTDSNAAAETDDQMEDGDDENEEYCGFAVSENLIDILYINFEQVERAFRYFDRNEDGFITKEEFRQACKEINLLLAPELKIRDTEDILMLMDIEETGEIPFNVFFEMYRLSEMKLNVGIDEEDTLSTPVMVHSETKDLMRGTSTASALQVSGKKHQLHLEIHGVEINIDTFLPSFDAQNPAGEPSLEQLEAAGIDV